LLIEAVMKILIADDDSVSRRLLQSHLQKWNYEVTLARDGAEAWQRFEEGLFPMVITDWMMPELDGPGLIRRIRSVHRPGYVYAMLLTSKSEKGDLVEGMEAGADDFLTKPFDRDELRVRLRAGERIIRLEHDLRDTQSTLVQTGQLASVGRLAAGVAHEINNPLAYVINNISVLGTDVESVLRLLDTYREGLDVLSREQPALAERAGRQEEELDLEYLRRNVGKLFQSSLDGLKRIRSIVQNLRTFARLDEADHKEIDLNEALKLTLEALRHDVEEKSLRVRTSLQAIPPLTCHPGKINQVLLNILLNAIQASEPGGQIEIRTRRDGNGDILTEIEDHGGGIRQEHLPHLFEPFFTTKPVGSGTGLGLSMSYGIVRDHGGSIDAESSIGKGALFRIRLKPQVQGPASGPRFARPDHALSPSALQAE
jgi:signal transduction histidine kinase